MSLHSSQCREIQPSFESGHLGVHSTGGSKLRAHLTDLLLREASLVVLVESWLTSSVEAKESALILRRYGVHGTFLELLC